MNALTTLALLEACMQEENQSKDRLDLFMPLVIDALGKFSDITFNISDMQTKIKTNSGIELPQTVVAALLTRSTRKGFVVRRSNSYERTNKKLPCKNIYEKRKEIEEKQRVLVESLIEYAKREEIGELSPEQAKSYLWTYLDSNFKSISVRTVGKESARDEDIGNINWINEFFLNAEKNNSEAFETAVSLVRGRIVYDAAFLPGFAEGEQRLKNVVAYLDSTLICRALGYVSDAEANFVREAIASLKNAGVVCRVLECTIGEIGDILTYVQNHWGRPQADEPVNSYLYCMPTQGFDIGYVSRVASNPELEVTSKLGLKVVPASGRGYRYITNADKLAERLRDRKKPDARNSPRIEHDINCIASVLAQRNDIYANSMKKAGCFFVTSSRMTIRNVNRWWTEDEGRKDLPPIFSLVDLANLVWLTHRDEESSGFQREALAAACAASMMPSERVWKKWINKLDSYVAEGDMTPEVACEYLYSIDVRGILAEFDNRRMLDEDDAFDVVIQKAGERIADRLHHADKNEYEEENKSLRELLESKDADKLKMEKSVSAVQDNLEKRVNFVYRGVVVLLMGAFILCIAMIVKNIFNASNDGSMTDAARAQIVIGAIGGIVAFLGLVISPLRQLIRRAVKRILIPSSFEDILPK